jgi:hypothetical protein
MALICHLAAVVINETLGAGGQLVAGTLTSCLESPPGCRPRPLIGEAEDTCQVLELALQRQPGGPPGWLGRLAVNAERSALADTIAALLESQPLILSNPDQARAALAELRSTPGRALLALYRAQIWSDRLQGMPRYAERIDVGGLVDYHSFQAIDNEGKNLFDFVTAAVWYVRRPLLDWLADCSTKDSGRVDPLCAILNCHGWIRSDDQLVVVRLEPLQQPARRYAQEQLCRRLMGLGA